MFYPKEYNLIEPLEYYRKKETLINDNKLLKQVFNFHSTFLEAIFGEENTDNDFTDEEVGKRKVSGPLAPKIKTLM